MPFKHVFCPRISVNSAIAVIAAIALVPAVCSALPEDRKQPINLAAGQARFDQRSGVSVYKGNVELTQGSMRLQADEAKVFVRDGAFQKMEATGNPTRFRYRPSADKPFIEGVGGRVEYDVKTQTVVVSGSAEFQQGGDLFSGETIIYDLKNDVVNAKGGGQQGRVKITLQPGDSRP